MGYHLLIEVKINNLKANALIDTGASRTVIDLNRLTFYAGNPETRQHGKPCYGVGAGQIQSFVTTLHVFTIGNKTLENFEVVSIDLGPINQNYAMFDLPRIDMVLGSDLLLKFGAIIDYSRKFLAISK